MKTKVTVPTDITIISSSDLPPEIIDILGKKFTIKLLEPTELEDCDGYMELAAQVIGLRLQPAPDYNHDTTFHEITHAVDEILCIGLRRETSTSISCGINSCT